MVTRRKPKTTTTSTAAKAAPQTPETETTSTEAEVASKNTAEAKKPAPAVQKKTAEKSETGHPVNLGRRVWPD